ncbi:hypothetical protein [Rhizobium leguminosarum]|uniref:hypothetical protein n=1 Tax=Rhizobium leguminosarum TaxID=384 RepID=UPI0014418A62|nr:hypothetical protein [Rhizobium leguminosarum]
MKRSIPKSYAKYAANATTRTAVAPIVDRASLRIPSPYFQQLLNWLCEICAPKMADEFEERANGFQRRWLLQSIHQIDGSRCRWIALRPLDRKREPGHKTRHENGYLHYLPEDYSLARALARPFSSPK